MKLLNSGKNSFTFRFKTASLRAVSGILVIFLCLSLCGCLNKLPTKSQPIVTVTSFKSDGIVMAIDEVGKNRIAVTYEKILEDNGQDPVTEKKFSIIDIAKDEVVSQHDLPATEDILGFGEKGKFLTRDYNSNLLCIYDTECNLIEKIDLPDYVTPLFDRKTDSVYFVKDDYLTKVDLNGKETKLLPIESEISIKGIDTENGLLVTEDGDLDGSGYTDYTVFSYLENRVLFTTDATALYGFTGSDILFEMMKTNDEDETNVIVDNYIKFLNKTTGETISEYKLPENTFVYESGDSDCVFLSSYSTDISDRGPKINYFLNLKTGKIAELNICEEDTYLDRVLFLTGQKYFVYNTSSADNPENSTLYVARIDAFDYSKDATKAHFETETPKIAETPESLKSQRELADKLEKEFSVKILLGDDALIMKNAINYRIVSTESPDYSDEGYVTSALEKLREVLESYPKGFFKKFQNYYGGAGLRFGLAGDLINDYGEFVPGGVFNFADGWYNVALNVSDVTSRQLVHHELWHATEERICHSIPGSFSDEKWGSFNPKNFEYTNDFDTYYKNDDYYKLTLETEKKDAYFIKIYSTCTEREDRATIVEEILTDYYSNSIYPEPDSLSHLKTYPNIKAKIDYMAEEVKSVFGTVYWEYILSK